MRIYNKLVRDKIPDIITANGGEYSAKTLTDEEYLSALDSKLSEELQEYYESHNLEELADLLEVIYAIANARGYSAGQLDSMREWKAQKRGRFDNKIMLAFVLEKEE